LNCSVNPFQRGMSRSEEEEESSPIGRFETLSLIRLAVSGPFLPWRCNRIYQVMILFEESEAMVRSCHEPINVVQSWLPPRNCVPFSYMKAGGLD